MGGVPIELKQNIKLLGLTIDNKLTFNTHISLTCKKAINIYKKLAKAAKVSWGLHPEVIRTIYTAAIEPIILYAASAWAPSANKLGARKQFGTVQRGFAQKICRAYRTVSLDSALVLAGMLPLDLRISEAASLYEAKKGVSQSVLGDREIERMTPYTEMPHPAKLISMKFDHLVDVNQYNAIDLNTTRIFTDGSKIEGKVGAAISIWTGQVEIKNIKLALPTYATVYQAELLALRRAASEVNKSKAVTFGIFSDSMAALMTATNPTSPHPLSLEFRKEISESMSKGKTINIYWIKAHVGFEGNERADILAKEAAIGSKRRPDYDLCPVSFVKRAIRDRTIGEWDERYRSGTTATVTKLFYPNVVEAYRKVRKTAPTALVTQLMTGHGGFSAYLARFKCKEDPSCTCEPGTEETVTHIVAECPIFAKLRSDTELQLGEAISPSNFHKLITGENSDVFLDYCKKIVRIVNEKNVNK
ncbi:uncharacterized protein LOC133320796 [Danaus plexippus]|uniref:uncharacterized protein LOC133320796 n=1 Tax=Danaus plexippus TaxID=13037 RepID=UPI002AB28336|nr:uncharacterized protein LOC133320796 [Danaus plexippus]